MKVFHFLSAKKLSKILKGIGFLEEYLKKEKISCLNTIREISFLTSFCLKSIIVVNFGFNQIKV